MREVRCVHKLQGQPQTEPLLSPMPLESKLVLGNHSGNGVMLMIYPQPSSVDLSSELGPKLGMGDTDPPTIGLATASWTPWPAGPSPGIPGTGLSLTAGEQSWERLLL